MKEESNSKYLEEQLKDNKVQFDELKVRYTQLLSFKDNLDTLNVPPVAKIDTKETDRLQEEIDRLKKEISDYRSKLITEAEKNNDYIKDLSSQIRTLRQK